MILFGEYFKVTRIAPDMERTLIVDTTGPSEPVRIIGIRRSHDQQGNLHDLNLFIIDRTILTGYVDATQ